LLLAPSAAGGATLAWAIVDNSIAGSPKSSPARMPDRSVRSGNGAPIAPWRRADRSDQLEVPSPHFSNITKNADRKKLVFVVTQSLGGKGRGRQRTLARLTIAALGGERDRGLSRNMERK